MGKGSNKMETISVVKGILTLALVIFIAYMLIRTKKSVKRYKNAKSNKRITKDVKGKSRSSSRQSNISRRVKPSNRNSKTRK